MRHAAARTTTLGPLRPTIVGLLVVSAAIIGTLVFQSESSSARSFSDTRSPGADSVGLQSPSSPAPAFNGARNGDDSGAITEDDGALPDGVTVFDDQYRGIANLDPDLLRALRQAAREAADEGIELHVKSGWRSHEYQDQLFRQAVSRYGSAKEAARWVSTADTSAHVSGEAVDIGSVDATRWLSAHGAHYGLCQIYRNESWHYELRPKAIAGGCPPMSADAAQDPRTRR